VAADRYLAVPDRVHAGVKAMRPALAQREIEALLSPQPSNCARLATPHWRPASAAT
jgi:hypothetical protein